MKVERLIANHPNDVRSLVNVLVQNGHIVWSMQVHDGDTQETNTVVFYTPQVVEEKEWFDVTPKVLEHITKVLRSIPFEEQWEEREPSAESEEKPDDENEEHSGSCPTDRNGCPCCLERGHAGDHMYKCASKECPGYAWPASENPHPGNTCK